MTRSVLVVAAHPDDEILGCGGTLAGHAKAGDNVHILIVAEGATSRDPVRDTERRDRQLEALRESARQAAQTIGAHPPRLLGLPDNRLDTLPLLDVIKAIEAVVTEVKPAIVYTHHAGDLNVDHRIVHQATVTACRPLPGSSVKAIYACETLSSTEWQSGGPHFVPQRWVDIEASLEQKLAALRAYESEMRPFPHARSLETVEALARVRGSSAGMAAAECFVVVREIAS